MDTSTNPLADRVRPRNFEEFVGQQDLVSVGKPLRKLVEQDTLPSMIFWGPPGVGKTTLAMIIANETKARFVALSGVVAGKSDLLEVANQAQMDRRLGGRTILFVDEIHRWNKAQQDALLPYVESGAIILIGATTENPSFEIIGALLSRSRVFILKSLSEDDIVAMLRQALDDKERGLGNIDINASDEVLQVLANLSGGDGRSALNGLELASQIATVNQAGQKQLTEELIKEALQRTHLVFDKNGEEFYNIISALHKSMRGSDANASLYWLARMLEGGVDPLYVARRVVRFASEDIGLANNTALLLANATYDACHKLGLPECSVHLAQAVVYCAKSKKSNLIYTGYQKAAEDAKATSHLGVPLHLRNATTKFMKNIGYGKDYKYNPDFTEPVAQEYLPKELKGKRYVE